MIPLVGLHEILWMVGGKEGKARKAKARQGKESLDTHETGRCGCALEPVTFSLALEAGTLDEPT